MAFAEVPGHCQSGPSVALVDPIMSAQDGCTGTAKIQGIAKSCQPLKKVASQTDLALQSLVQDAQKICRQHCQNRSVIKSGQCLGFFERSQGCAQTVEIGQAMAAGINSGCDQNCAGRALSFCSLYPSSYTYIGSQRTLPSEAPNCFCRLQN